MRVTSLLLLPVIAGAFTPQVVQRRFSLKAPKAVSVSEVCDNVNSKVETVLEKADDLIVKRAMRLVNHAPVFVTLGSLASKLGSSKWGLDIAPSALSVASPGGLSVPTWVGYVLRLIVVAQAASMAKSALADDEDDLSQSEISALAVSNFALGRALTDSSPVNWALAAVASGYSARNGGGGGDAGIHNFSTQVASSVATIATVLAAVNALPGLVPMLAGQTELTAGIALAAYYALAIRDGNSQVKKVMNGAVVGGILWSRIAGGALNLSVSNLLSVGTLVTVGVGYVAYVAIDKAREAVF